jgi:hypothetical protein
MQSEEERERGESVPPPEKGAPRRRANEQSLRSPPSPAVAKADPKRGDRLSGDHIHLSPRAQRRMAMGRRTGF